MFCVECGKELEELTDGLCDECYSSRLQADIPEHIDIEVCTSCWSVRLGGRWKERPDMHSIMLERIDDALSISPQVERYSFRADFKEEDPKNTMAHIKLDLYRGDIKVERELTSRIILKKEQCTTCSRIHGNYYEAILQIRPSTRELSHEQRDVVKGMVKREVEERRGDDRKIFITSTQEIHGGLDFYMSDNGVTKKLAKVISEKFGGKVTVSSKLAGRKDGQDIYKMTYSVRLPPYERGDFVNYDERIFRVMEIRTSSGHVTLLDIETGNKVSIERWDFGEVGVLGSEELIREAVVVSETEKEIKVLDPDNYNTVTLLKPQGLEISGDHVDIIKFSGKLYLIVD